MKPPAIGIAAKITAGYLVLIAGMVAAQVYQVSLVHQMQSINQRLYRVNYEAGTSSVQLLNDLYSIDDRTRRFFAVSDRGPYAEKLGEDLADFGKKVADLSALDLSAGEREELKRLRGILDDFEATLSPYLESPAGAVPDETQEDLHQRLGELYNQTRRLIPVIRKQIEAKIAESDAANERVQTVSWLALGGALAVGLLVGSWIVRSISVPIRQLSRATRGLAEGDFSFRIDDSGRDEVADLARNFNAMVRRLDELDQLKGDFVSHVSHELKAPLASMQETSKLLLEEIPGAVNPKQRRLLELNLQSGRRLSAMIGNLLDLSRLESGAPEYDFHTVDLRELVSEAVQELEPLARERQCVLSHQPAERPLNVVCDAGRILQILRNLIDNAIKFSPTGSEVKVAVDFLPRLPATVPPDQRAQVAESADGYAVVSVIDRGPGVPPEHREKIFDKFHQVKRGRKVSGQGVGLGLAISRSIAQAHRAAVWAEENPGGGTVFRLLLGLGG